MIRRILMYLIPLALGVAVLLAARHLDSAPWLSRAATEPNEMAGREETIETTAATEETEPAETVPVETAASEERYVFTFAGDCTLGSNPEHVTAGFGFVRTVGEDYDYPFRNVLSYFEQDDFTMVNLEGALTERGIPSGVRYSFRGSPDYISILTRSSVEAVNLANNHALDYGPVGYEDTKELLADAKIGYVERDNSALLELENGLTVGLYGAVYYKFDVDHMEKTIRELREAGADVVIFTPHWGAEGVYRPTEEQKILAHKAIDAGADIVFGTHPHVLQPVEEYNDGVIFYSLANFSFGGNIYPEDFDTALIQQEIIVDASGEVSLGETTLIPCSVSSITERNNFQPTPYAEGTEEYDRAISKLNGTFTGRNLTTY